MERRVFGNIQDRMKHASKTVFSFGLAGLLTAAGCQPPQQFDIQPAPPEGTALVRFNEVFIGGKPALISINCGTDPTTEIPEEQIQKMHDIIVRAGTNPNSVYPVNLMDLKRSPRLASICAGK